MFRRDQRSQVSSSMAAAVTSRDRTKHVAYFFVCMHLADICWRAVSRANAEFFRCSRAQVLSPLFSTLPYYTFYFHWPYSSLQFSTSSSLPKSISLLKRETLNVSTDYFAPPRKMTYWDLSYRFAITENRQSRQSHQSRQTRQNRSC